MVNTSKLKLTILQINILRKLFIKTGSVINQRQLAIKLNFYDSFEKIHKHLKENLANGIILTGGFEL
jgi:hypothetical protein